MRTISSTKFESLITYGNMTYWVYDTGTEVQGCEADTDEFGVLDFTNADEDGRTITLYEFDGDDKQADYNAMLRRSVKATSEMFNFIVLGGWGLEIPDCKIACTVGNDGTTVYMLIY